MSLFEVVMFLFIIACFVVAALPPGWLAKRREQRTLTGTEPTLHYSKMGFVNKGSYIYHPKRAKQ